MTVEDPVEYQLPGVSQVQVHRKAGLTFATALRSFMRQDPDIIMVGEIRDLETAEMAIQASLTGHLVLSTLHTNDAPSTVTRLVDMGVEPFLVSATLIGVLAQRLGRRICANCKEQYEVERRSAAAVLGYQPEDGEKVALWRGRGCESCRQTGYKGRIGIYELMMVNEEIAELMVRRAPVSDITQAARANGMKTLQEDGLRKVLAGITTPEEIRASSSRPATRKPVQIPAEATNGQRPMPFAAQLGPVHDGKPDVRAAQTQVQGQQQYAPGAGRSPGQKRPVAGRAHIDDLLRIVVEWKGSDLHMTVGVPPVIRMDGTCTPTPYERVTPQDAQRMCYDILTDEQIQRFESTWSWTSPTRCRGWPASA